MTTFQKNKSLTADEILAKMEHFCAYRERCPQEVRRKLTELGARGETADQIYSVLESEGFFNEARFASAFAGGKFRVNQWGRVRIRLELRQRGISPDIIRAAIDEIGEEAYQRILQQLIEKKRQQWPSPDDAAARSKTAAAMIRAGYEPELVFRYL